MILNNDRQFTTETDGDTYPIYGSTYLPQLGPSRRAVLATSGYVILGTCKCTITQIWSYSKFCLGSSSNESYLFALN